MKDEGRWLNLDRFVDVDGLKALDEEVRHGIVTLLERHGRGEGMMGHQINRFFPSLPDLRLDKTQPALSHLSTINLHMPRAYTRIHLQQGAVWTEMSKAFPGLVAWARTLPFEQFGRFFVIFDQAGNDEPIHHGPVPYQEFFWLRTNLDKEFFVYDETTETKHYFDGHAVWFDQHSYHGCDPTPDGELQWSIRIDGVFEPAVRRHVAEHFKAWSEQRRALVPRFETGRDLDDLFPDLAGTPDELGTAMEQTRTNSGET